MTQKTLYTFLSAAGCVPFIFAAASPHLGMNALPLSVTIEQSIAFYGLAIVSFMAGSHWGLSIHQMASSDNTNTYEIAPTVAKPNNTNIMLLSNAILVFPWLILSTLGSSMVFFLVLVLAFLILLVTDCYLVNRQIISQSYFRMRVVITLIVVVCLMSITFNLPKA